MIPNSALIAGFATAGSIAVHGLLLGFVPTVEPARQMGGSQAEIAVAGYGFSDLVQGVTAPAPIAASDQPAPALKTVAPVEEQQATLSISPAQLRRAPVVEALNTAAQHTPKRTPRLPTVASATAIAPSSHLQPVSLASRALTPAENDSPQTSDAAVEASLRPPSHIPERNTTESEVPPRAVPAKPAQTLASGNAPRTERRGSDSPEKTARAESANKLVARPARASGTAAASNYPGRVRQKLSQTQRPRLTARGSAQVAFSIAPSGRLSDVRLSRSSGSPAIDSAALQHVREAAPFPPPPPGAQRAFGFTFSVK